MDSEQLIQDYLKNKLSDEGIKTFNKGLETDADFKNKFEEYVDIQNAFKLSEAQNLKEQLNDLEPKHLPLSKKLFNNKYLNLAYAAVLVIGLFFVFNSKTNTNQLFNDYIDTYPNVYQPITRGQEKNDSYKAFQAYENRNFNAAEIQFSELLKTDTNPNLQFYYAMSLLENNKLDLALSQLKNLATKKHEFTAEVQWYSALINLKNKDLEAVKTHLNTLKKSDSSFKTEEAEAILNKIN